MDREDSDQQARQSHSRIQYTHKFICVTTIQMLEVPDNQQTCPFLLTQMVPLLASLTKTAFLLMCFMWMQLPVSLA